MTYLFILIIKIETILIEYRTFYDVTSYVSHHNFSYIRIDMYVYIYHKRLMKKDNRI